ncbi:MULTISPECIES: hypothetical protein [unclassified Enterococcus]|uniref:hypothetical protein n=1 Tax=unclassified Enterococcus TaxID=2608891 RepID=UPI003F22BBEA
MNVSEERKITAGTISGATFKSIDIEPSIIVDGKSYTASEFNKAVEMLKQPQLNNSQQELLDDLKYVYSWQHSHAWDLFYYLVDSDRSMFEDDTIRNFQSLSDDESLKVLIIFSQWVLSPKD